jgi:hypothetical protein
MIDCMIPNHELPLASEIVTNANGRSVLNRVLAMYIILVSVIDITFHYQEDLSPLKANDNL